MQVRQAGSNPNPVPRPVGIAVKDVRSLGGAEDRVCGLGVLRLQPERRKASWRLQHRACSFGQFPEDFPRSKLRQSASYRGVIAVRWGPCSCHRQRNRGYDVVMNLVKKLMSWWRGPTDPETLAREAEEQRLLADQHTIRVSQGMTGKATSASLASAPTPDLLHPGRQSHKSR